MGRFGPMLALLGLMAGATVTSADTWQERKQDVEWAFKLGAVSVALEKCPFENGPRFVELETNAKDVVPVKGVRSLEEGREHMLILDGPDLSALCGTAWKFYGASGKDLSGVLALKNAEKKG